MVLFAPLPRRQESNWERLLQRVDEVFENFDAMPDRGDHLNVPHVDQYAAGTRRDDKLADLLIGRTVLDAGRQT